MRKVIFAINMSIDGCVDYTRLTSPCEEGSIYVNNLIKGAGLIAYGRKMYQIMFPYWAKEANRETEEEIEFGRAVTDMEKIVFSRSLERADYNTRIVRTDPAAELLKLKQSSGKNIYVGTVSMLPQLMQHGVIDEYHLIVSPVIIGKGTRLVEDGTLVERLQLKLIESRVFKSGSVALKYAR
jgi:dihydrofolate reductase